MKIKIVKQPAVIEEVEIQMPCYRKRYDNYAYVYDKGHISLNLYINSIYNSTANGSEFFDDKSEKSTKEEFQNALAKLQHNITAIEKMII